MPNYQYKAKNLDGEIKKGVIEAADEKQVYAALREQNEFLIHCREVETKYSTKALKAKELADFSNQLGTMLSAGISLSRTLSIMVQRMEKKRLKQVYIQVYQMVRQGVLLSDAMERQGRTFPPLMINMVRAGESSGRMDEIAGKMAKHYEKDSRLQARVKSAMAYPVFLVILTAAVILLIFIVILPQFGDLFDDMDLPLNTRILMGFSSFLVNHGMLVFFGTAMFVTICLILFKNPKVHRRIDCMKLKLPVFAGIFTTIYTARFARGLSSLYSSGLSMLQSLQICRGLVGNQYMEEQFDGMIDGVRNGVPLSKVMSRADGWDTKLAASIYVGEESGRINEILDTLADSFEYEAEQSTQKMINIMEPLLIIIIAGIVGFVVLSVMVPIIQYYKSMA